jgi:hypothetical protein
LPKRKNSILLLATKYQCLYPDLYPLTLLGDRPKTQNSISLKNCTFIDLLIKGKYFTVDLMEDLNQKAKAFDWLSDRVSSKRKKIRDDDENENDIY